MIEEIYTKATKAIENIPKIYENGKSAGHDKGYNEGQQAQYDLFWDTIQNNGGKKYYKMTFVNFPPELYQPKYDFIHGQHGSAYLTFSEFKGTDIIKDNDCTLAYGDGLNHTFWNCPNLVNARTLTVTEVQPFNNTFNSCPKLEEVRFKGTIAKAISFQWSPLLSKASIIGDEATAEEIAAEKNIITLNGKSYYKGIFGALSDKVSSVTITFRKTAIDTAFETSVGAADGSTSSEWNTLVALKPNWTIALA